MLHGYKLPLFCFLLLVPYASIKATEQKNVIDYYCITRMANLGIFNISRLDHEFECATTNKNLFNIFFILSSTHKEYYFYDCSQTYTAYYTKECDVKCDDCYEEISIYDGSGQYEGKILGDNIYGSSFYFYNALDQHVASASFTYDREQNQMRCLVHSESDIALLTSNAVNKVEVVIYHPEKISAQLLKVFAIFICEKRILETVTEL